MSTWQLRFRPKSPWVTPWRADSLFGALSWRWVELSPKTFPFMLERFRSQESPPFVISDAFPGDLLPMPLHAISEKSTSGKKLRAPLYVHKDVFRAVARGDTPYRVDPEEDPVRGSSILRTSIDRHFDRAAEGMLFETDTQYLGQRVDSLSVYIRSDSFLQQVLDCFNALALTGFGKKSSTGLGAFDIVAPPEPCDWLDHVEGANAFMSLSHFVPALNDPSDGYWRTHVTYPKFHANCVSNVFKETMLMLTPGSVFHTNEGPPRQSYGCVIPVPRPEMPLAVHYAYCFPAPLVWRKVDA